MHISDNTKRTHTHTHIQIHTFSHKHSHILAAVTHAFNGCRDECRSLSASKPCSSWLLRGTRPTQTKHHALQWAAECCSVFQCVAVCCCVHDQASSRDSDLLSELFFVFMNNLMHIGMHGRQREKAKERRRDRPIQIKRDRKQERERRNERERKGERVKETEQERTRARQFEKTVRERKNCRS